MEKRRLGAKRDPGRKEAFTGQIMWRLAVKLLLVQSAVQMRGGTRVMPNVIR